MKNIGDIKYPIFRLWEAPSFEPTISWTILVDRFATGYQNPLLRRVIGSKLTAFTSIDVFKDMQDDISQKNVRVDDYLLKPHEFDALGLYERFPFQIPRPDDYFGSDETIYGMQICSPLPVFIVKWWEDGPDGWREMTDWAYQKTLYLSWLIDRFSQDFKDINQTYPPDHKIWRSVDKK